MEAVRPKHPSWPAFSTFSRPLWRFLIAFVWTTSWEEPILWPATSQEHTTPHTWWKRCNSCTASMCTLDVFAWTASGYSRTSASVWTSNWIRSTVKCATSATESLSCPALRSIFEEPFFQSDLDRFLFNELCYLVCIQIDYCLLSFGLGLVNKKFFVFSCVAWWFEVMILGRLNRKFEGYFLWRKVVIGTWLGSVILQKKKFSKKPADF